MLPKMVKKLSGHTGTVTSIDVSMDKSQFFSGSTDGSVKVWSWEGGNFECVLDSTVSPLPFATVCNSRWPGLGRNKVTVNAGGPVECVLVFYPWLFAGTTGTNSVRK